MSEGAHPDLFGEIPVTEADVELWLDLVPSLSKSGFRREAYRKAYRVEEKIRGAKRAGKWPPEAPQVYSTFTS